MKITVINGQNHKGSTWHIGDQLVHELGGGHELWEFFLPHDLPHHCIGCATCINRSEAECPHAALVSPIVAAIDWAEILILTSPTYCYHASGAMKTLLDHLSWRWLTHRPSPLAFKKQAVVISTSAGSTSKHALRDMSDSLKFWGIPVIEKFGIPIWASSWEQISPDRRRKIDKGISLIARRLTARQGRVKPGLEGRLLFTIFKGLQTKGWNPVDQAYWKSQGWLDGAVPW